MPARVLVVDDVLTNVKLLDHKLTAEYFDVITAMSGQEALDACARSQCDIVLLDLMMPGMDGFEVCRRLKADPATYHIPIVIITALDQASDLVAGLEAGADDFLTKPVSDLALFARVRNLTRIKQMTDELRVRAMSGAKTGFGGLAADPIVDDGLNGRILLVDDRPSSYERIKAALQESHMVDVETTPQEALFRAAEAQYDLMIVSLGLKDYDGLRLCSQARSLERTRTVPILALAEPDDTARVLRGLDLGINDYLTRPVDRNELLARVMTQVRRKRYSDRLRNDAQRTYELAVTDPLTGMHNRRYLENQLDKLLDPHAERKLPLSLVMVDIDHFKAINDAHGHDCGDEVLKEFAGRVRHSVRGSDVVSRYGGEEFVILMPETNLAIARQVGERLLKKVAGEPFGVRKGRESMQVTISIGIASSHEGDTPESVMKRADVALYRAKSDGRNRVVFDAA